MTDKTNPPIAWRSQDLATSNEARRIAANIAKLPDPCGHVEMTHQRTIAGLMSRSGK